MPRHPLLALVSLVLAVGCSSSGGGDAPPESDSGPAGDSPPGDTATPDTRSSDGGVDTAVADSRSADSGTPDTAIADTAVVDSAAADSATDSAETSGCGGATAKIDKAEVTEYGSGSRPADTTEQPSFCDLAAVAYGSPPPAFDVPVDTAFYMTARGTGAYDSDSIEYSFPLGTTASTTTNLVLKETFTAGMLPSYSATKAHLILTISPAAPGSTNPCTTDGLVYVVDGHPEAKVEYMDGSTVSASLTATKADSGSGYAMVAFEGINPGASFTITGTKTLGSGTVCKSVLAKAFTATGRAPANAGHVVVAGAGVGP